MKILIFIHLKFASQLLYGILLYLGLQYEQPRVPGKPKLEDFLTQTDDKSHILEKKLVARNFDKEYCLGLRTSPGRPTSFFKKMFFVEIV